MVYVIGVPVLFYKTLRWARLQVVAWEHVLPVVAARMTAQREAKRPVFERLRNGQRPRAAVKPVGEASVAAVAVAAAGAALGEGGVCSKIAAREPEVVGAGWGQGAGPPAHSSLSGAAAEGMRRRGRTKRSWGRTRLEGLELVCPWRSAAPALRRRRRRRGSTPPPYSTRITRERWWSPLPQPPPPRCQLH